MLRRRCWYHTAAIAVGLVVSGCAPTHVAPVAEYVGPKLAAPEIVVVEDYVIEPASISLDQGVRSRLFRRLGVDPEASDPDDIAATLSNAFAEKLVEDLKAHGLPAVRGTAGDAAGKAASLVVAGEFTRIDQGNETKRNLVGLGRGASSVAGETTVTYAAGGRRGKRVLSYDSDAESGDKPGAAETMGVGAASGKIGEAVATTAGSDALSETLATSVVDDGKRMAGKIADQIAAFGVAQGWIAK